MTVATSTLLGRPLWYELMTTDMKAAEEFYRHVVGWKTAPFEGAGQPYTMFNRGGDTPVGGVMTRPDEMKAPPFWAMYVGVPRLEEAARQIKRLGGSALLRVITVPSVGRMQMMAIRKAPRSTSTSREPRDQRPETRARSRRGVVARADDDRRARGDEVLPGHVRLGAERSDGHGADGHVPDVQPPARHDRRHDEQAAGDGQRAAATGRSISACPTCTRPPSASRRTAGRSSTARWRCRAATGS